MVASEGRQGAVDSLYQEAQGTVKYRQEPISEQLFVKCSIQQNHSTSVVGERRISG